MIRFCLWGRGNGVKERSWDIRWLKSHSGESECLNIFLSCLLWNVQGKPLLLYLYCCKCSVNSTLLTNPFINIFKINFYLGASLVTQW